MSARVWTAENIALGRVLGLRRLCSQLHHLSFTNTTNSNNNSNSNSNSNSKLFVGGLSLSVDEMSLRDAFSSFGAVLEVKILYDKDSGRSRGFGFVCFSNQADAQCAKDAMDGKALLGRPLRINYALEKVRGASVVVPRLS